MADYELLELLLALALLRIDVKPLAKTLIKEFGGLLSRKKSDEFSFPHNVLRRGGFPLRGAHVPSNHRPRQPSSTRHGGSRLAGQDSAHLRW